MTFQVIAADGATGAIKKTGFGIDLKVAESP
jgi:hypothetical protein